MNLLVSFLMASTFFDGFSGGLSEVNRIMVGNNLDEYSDEDALPPGSGVNLGPKEKPLSQRRRLTF